jgi:hypothetical protein
MAGLMAAMDAGPSIRLREICHQMGETGRAFG